MAEKWPGAAANTVADRCCIVRGTHRRSAARTAGLWVACTRAQSSRGSACTPYSAETTRNTVPTPALNCAKDSPMKTVITSNMLGATGRPSARLQCVTRLYGPWYIYDEFHLATNDAMFSTNDEPPSRALHARSLSILSSPVGMRSSVAGIYSL